MKIVTPQEFRKYIVLNKMIERVRYCYRNNIEVDLLEVEKSYLTNDNIGIFRTLYMQEIMIRNERVEIKPVNNFKKKL